ncbi:hypothetical protein AAVH_22538 [Aphelenchoides avenae]|nr:hypothetical protein AAVH_22538 [Aphelenchus avenae]
MVLDSAKQQLGQPKGPESPAPPNPPPPPAPVPAGPANSPQHPDPSNPAPPQPQPQPPTGAGNPVPPQPPTPESGAQTHEILKALDELKATGIFLEDHGFMRKVAWKESRDGEILGKSNDVNVKNGGIWQISKVALEEVQKNLAQEKKTELKDKFGVDVSKVNRDNGDLLNVRTAAAVARAFVSRKPKLIPVRDAEQADYWVRTVNI